MSVLPTREQVPQLVRGATLPRGRPAAASAGGMTGRDFFRILRKRKWLIIFSVISWLVIAAAATLLWLLYAPLWKATALVGVNPPQASGLGPVNPLVGRDIMDRLTTSQAQLVKREPILQRVLESGEIRKTEWHRRTKPEDAIKTLSEDISVSPVPTTHYIQLSMMGLNRDDLPVIVNEVAKAFLGYVNEKASTDWQEEISKLQVERRSLADQRDRLRTQAKRTVDEADVPKLGERRRALLTRLQILTNRRTELEIDQAAAQESVRMIRETAAQEGLANSPEVDRLVEADPSMRSLRATEMNLITRLENLRRRFGDRHREVQSLEATLVSIRKRIAGEDEKLRALQARLVVQFRESELARVTAQLLQVREKYNEADTDAREVQEILAAVEEFTTAQESLEEAIGRIDARLVDLRVIARRQQLVWLASPASRPREPSMPQWKIMMPLGAFLGIVLGLGLAFLLEFIDTSIKGPSDIARRVDLPLLGMVPHTDDMEEEIEDLRLAFMTNPNSLVGEAFRQIRTCLLFSGPAEQRRCLLVTSPLPEDGRTTVTMNLAAAMSSGGRKVLVVDANFRQPMIRSLYPDCGEAGLSSALVEQSNWSDLVHQAEPDLFVMSAGPLPPNPAELLGSDQMRQIIAEMAEQYDQVIFDGAPCLVVADSPILSTAVDGVVLVVRAGTNTYGIVQRTRDMLARVGARVLGVVLNGVRTTAGGYLRQSYNTFYEYHEQSQLPEK